MQRITDIDDDRVSCFRSLREQRFGAIPGTFIAEGEKVVLRVLESTLSVVSTFLQEENFERHQHRILEDRVPCDKVYVTSKKLMTEIVGFSMHQGMLALVREPEDTPLKILPTPIVALNAVADSENMGAIVRNCQAFCVRSLLVDRLSCSPWLRRAVRVSMGTIFDMQIHRCSELATALTTLQSSRSLPIYAIDNIPGAVNIHQATLDKNCVVVFGSEGRGIDSATLQTCQRVFQIPMSSNADSLNVTAASAIVLDSIFRL